MGATKRKMEETRERRFKRGRNNGSGGVADYGTIDAALLRSAIESVALSGGALRFGYTRDGGAYAVGIYGDGDPYTEYVRPSEDFNEFLQEIIGSFA